MTTIECAPAGRCFPTTPSPPESTPIARHRGPDALLCFNHAKDVVRQFDKRKGSNCELCDLDEYFTTGFFFFLFLFSAETCEFHNYLLVHAKIIKLFV
jgi:hypothetical protein